ncbi:MAG: hypothetical protein NTY38_32275, partial [Acidobacteria bacterium]|nr:hypothetical protein [Acidobacteriota bacterium]
FETPIGDFVFNNVVSLQPSSHTARSALHSLPCCGLSPTDCPYQRIRDGHMDLTLDHTQRLNLHALLGAQRADVGSIRAIWAVQDKIALDADEEKAIELRREMVAGQEHVVWNPALSLPTSTFEFTDGEVAKIKVSIETWDSYGANADRRWLQPLVDALFHTEVGRSQG